MIILSSGEIPYNMQKHLKNTYRSAKFYFCDNMEEAQEHLSNAEILVTYGEDLDAELIKQAEKLKWIMVLSAGMDIMPFDEIKKRNILVTNARGIHKIPMAEYAFSMLLQVSRQTKKLIKLEEEHKWDRSVPMQEIYGKTLVVVGTGAIGQEVARLAKAFRMKTIGVSKSGSTKQFFDEVYKGKDLNFILRGADFVVSVLPSTKETKYLFDHEHFQRMPKQAVFLNMGRGDAVNENALLDAIQNKEIAHAVLDVVEQEPLPAEHPFWANECITVTPHLSGISPEYLPRAIEIFETNLDKYLNGEKDYMNEIDPRKGY